MLRERKVRHPNWWVLHTVPDALHILHPMDLAMLETRHRLLRDFVAWKTSWGHHSDRANSREFQPQGMERLIHPFSAKVGRRKLFSSSYRKAGTDDHWINIFFFRWERAGGRAQWVSCLMISLRDPRRGWGRVGGKAVQSDRAFHCMAGGRGTLTEWSAAVRQLLSRDAKVGSSW